MNITQPIRHHAATTPDAPAFIAKSGHATGYAQLERAIDAVAQRALELGLAPGQCAAVAAADLFRHYVIALALARIGVAHGPIYLPERTADIAIADDNVPFAGRARRISVDALWSKSGDGIAPVGLHLDGAAPYMYCPTSGTTRTPKFVPISHAVALTRSRARSAAAAASGRGIAAMRLASLVGPGTSYGFSSALLVLHGGGAVVEPTFVREEMNAWFARSGVNYLIASPIALQKVLQALPGFIENTLDAIEVGGGPLAPAVYEDARARLCSRITMNYGLTECGRVASAPMQVVQEKLGGVGYPYHGVTLRIVDAQDRPLPAGEEGLLCIRSASNATGYLDNPAAVALVFRDGWVYPGDRAMLDDDGFLRVLGRADDVINLGGVKVHPQAVEDAMLALGDVREVAVFAVEHGASVPSLCAAVVPSPQINADAYHQRCRERLGARAPALIVHMAELPRNAMGKVQRADLARKVLDIEKKRQS